MDALNLVFIFFSFVAVALLCFYFYRLAEHDKQEWVKKEYEETVKEKDAEEWLDHSFVPHILSFIKQKPKIIIKYTFFILLAAISLWSYISEGTQAAARNAFFTCVIYSFAILYIYTEPRLFAYAKNHLHRKMRRRFDNEWIRAYAFFLLPACVIYFFLPQPLTFTFYLLAYSALFLCLLAATRLSEDFGKEEEKERKKIVKKMLEEK
jgi:di/tricarboxylate transporter